MELFGVIKKIVSTSDSKAECLVLTEDRKLILAHIPFSKRLETNRDIYMQGSFEDSAEGRLFNASQAGFAVSGYDLRRIPEERIAGTIIKIREPEAGDESKKLVVKDQSGAQWIVIGHIVTDGLMPGDTVSLLGNEYGFAGKEHLFWADVLSSQDIRKVVGPDIPGEGDRVTVEGRVISVTARRDDGWAGVIVDTGKGRMTASGIMQDIEKGMSIRAEGTFFRAGRTGLQVSVDSYSAVFKDRREEITAYLVRNINGLGYLDAARIYERFGDSTIDILTDSPVDIYKVSRMEGDKEAVREHFRSLSAFRAVEEKLAPLGMDDAMLRTACSVLGQDVVKAVKNPYILFGTIPGAGFAEVDRIAMKAGYPKDGRARMESAVLDALMADAHMGSNCTQEEVLVSQLADRLEVGREIVSGTLDRMSAPPGRAIRRSEGMVYLPELYKAERRSAEMLSDLSSHDKSRRTHQTKPIEYEQVIKSVSGDVGHPVELDESHRSAVEMAVSNYVSVISGPMNEERVIAARAVAWALAEEGARVAHVAATNQAAIELRAITGRHYTTLETLLELSSKGYGRNAENPLPYNAVIVDACQSIDILMLEAFLSAIPKKTRLVFVGDSDRLPDIGNGSFFQDLISAGAIPVSETGGYPGRRPEKDNTRSFSYVLLKRKSLLAARLKGQVKETQRIRSKNGEHATRPKVRKTIVKTIGKQSKTTEVPSLGQSEEKTEVIRKETVDHNERRPDRFGGREILRKPMHSFSKEDRDVLSKDGRLGKPYELDGRQWVVALHPAKPGVVLLEPVKDILTRLREVEGIPFREALDLSRGAAVMSSGRALYYDVFSGTVTGFGNKEKESALESALTDVDKAKLELSGRKDVLVMSVNDFIKTSHEEGNDTKKILESLTLTRRMEGIMEAGKKTFIAELHPSYRDVVLVMDSFARELLDATRAFDGKVGDNLRYGQGFYDKDRNYRAYSIYENKAVVQLNYGKMIREVLAKQEKEKLDRLVSEHIEKALKEGTNRHI